MNKMKTIALAATVVLFAACSQTAKENKAGIAKADFEKTIDNKQVSLWTLTNANGIEMTVTNYGGKVVSLLVPDKNGKLVDVVTGYKTIAEYEASTEIYFGAAIGRYGNRIANGKFTLNGEEYTLAQNNGDHHLHGGPKGFHAVVWDAEQTDASTLVLSYLSIDGKKATQGISW
jgi:aldose 1-epimerase